MKPRELNNFDNNSKGVNITAKIFYDTLLAQDEFQQNFKRINEDEFLYIDYGNIPSEIDLENCNKYISKGYSQGDIATVLIPLEELKKCWGNFDLEKLKSHIDHLFWDCPVNGTIKINNDEYYISELINDPYNYDKNEVIKQILKQIGDNNDNIKDELIKLLPEDIDYY